MHTVGEPNRNRNKSWLPGVILVAALMACSGGDKPAADQDNAPAAGPVASAEQKPGQQAYQLCATCHQQNGEGLPGAFPPLAGHVPQLLAAEGGRDYVVHVLLYGMQGPITVDGKNYNGAMPSWAHLSDAELAAVIDYVSTSWGDEFPSGQQSFTAADFETARAKELTAQEVHDLRQQLNLP